MVLQYRLDVASQHVPQASYALRIMLEGLGIPAREAKADEPADLVYGPTRPADTAVWVRHVPIEADWSRCVLTFGSVDGLPALIPPGGPGKSDGRSGAVDADLIAAAFTVLSGRAEETLPGNAFGVPALAAGFKATELLARPILAEYMQILGGAIEARWPGYAKREPLWPGGARWAIVLSHDVDMPYRRPSPRFYGRRSLAQACSGRIDRAAASLLIGAVRVLQPRRPNRDRRFGFDFWSAVARQNALPGTLYVAATSAATGDPLDVGYELEDRGLRDALHAWIDEGGEVGLHASLWARQEWTRMREERQRLEHALGGRPVVGVRHHFWALDPYRPERTWRSHSAAGFSYDSSLGINAQSGFRRGMAWPFHPFDHHHREPMSLLQIPPTCMDGAIAAAPSEGRIEALKAHLEQVRAAGGAAVLNWHVEQADRERLGGVGPLLASLLRPYTAERELYRATPAQMAAWWKERAERLARRAEPTERVPHSPDRDAKPLGKAQPAPIPRTARRIKKP